MINKFGLVPFSEPMAVVFGKPIRMEQNKEPSQAVIDFYHKVSFPLSSYSFPLLLFDEIRNIWKS
jgi:hypothetical protein